MQKQILWVALLLTALSLFAEIKVLDVNGSFEKIEKIKGKEVPAMWIINYAGEVKLVKDAADGKNALFWEYPKGRKNAYMTTKEQFKCKPGDSIFISLKVKGKGKLRVCIFPKHGKFTARTCDNNLQINSKEFKSYEIEMEVPEDVYKGCKINAFKPGLQLFPGGTVTIDNIKVSFEKK